MAGKSGGSLCYDLMGLFDTMVDLMADRAIDEMPSGDFASSADDAYYRAIELCGVLHGDREEIPGGYRITLMPTGYSNVESEDWFVLTRQSQQWNSLRSKYHGRLSRLKDCVSDVASALHGPSIANMETVYTALIQRGSFSEIEAKELRKEHPELIADLGGDMPVWSNIEQMNSNASSWSGDFITALKDTYLNQLPHILLGQLAVAGYLQGSLQLSQSAVKQAQSDLGNLLDGTIKKLEEAAGGAVDINWTSTLSVASQISGSISGVSALIPGGQGFSAGFGLASTLTGLGGTIAGKFEGKPDAAEKEVTVSGDTVDEIAESFTAAVATCLNQIAAVENSAADMLSELSILINDNTNVTENIDDISVDLTLRDANFRPKPVAGGDAGKSLPGDSDFDNLEIKDVDSLARMGATTFPMMADEYRSLNSNLMGVNSVGDALIRSTIAEKSRLYGEWTSAQSELSTLFTESSANLNSVGGVIAQAALDIEGTDLANGTSLEAATRELIEEDH